MPVLNKGQSECLDKLIEWWKGYNHRKQTFQISGLAGCGKTFLIRHLIETMDDLKFENVLFVAYVGKAAMQMARTGLNASTIHSAIYFAVEVPKKDEFGNNIMKEGRVVLTTKFFKKPNLDPNIKLIVVDEAPMVDAKVAADLLSFKLPMICLGDLNQLPPVIGEPFFLRKPDYTLTEIMRQKAGNPILDLAQHIIHDKFIQLKPGTYGDKLTIIKRKDFMDFYSHKLLESDVVICGKNSTRDELNKTIRALAFKARGFEGQVPDLSIGDKLICRKNNWAIEEEGINLINGLVGTVQSIDFENKGSDTIPIDFKPDFIQSTFEGLKLNTKYFYGTRQYKEALKKTPHSGELFEFGYAITCHLSQGSQYEKVIVFSEVMGDTEYYRKWLYTAVTRASEELILII